MLGNLVPLLNPIRVAEEYATADVISRGRLEIGFAERDAFGGQRHAIGVRYGAAVVDQRVLVPVVGPGGRQDGSPLVLRRSVARARPVRADNELALRERRDVLGRQLCGGGGSKPPRGDEYGQEIFAQESQHCSVNSWSRPKVAAGRLSRDYGAAEVLRQGLKYLIRQRAGRGIDQSLVLRELRDEWPPLCAAGPWYEPR